jgi:hypothetical protein
VYFSLDGNDSKITGAAKRNVFAAISDLVHRLKLQEGQPMTNAKPIAMTREAAADRRIAAALDALQEAQNLVGHARAALSSLYGVTAESVALGKVYDQVKRNWYRLEEKAKKQRQAGKLLLDHEPNEYEREFGPLPDSATPVPGTATAGE